jgi:RNA polymerase sigma-70 factor (ECF subfamily)
MARHQMSDIRGPDMAAVLPIEPANLPRRIGNGDTTAFAELMRKHNRMLFRTARAILRDDAEAEDALQEAYLRAYWSIGRFRGEA